MSQTPPPAGYPDRYLGAPTASTNGFAVASLVLGILGPIMCICWILALVFGYVARKQIDESNGRQTGRGMAIAGITLGWVWFGAGVLAWSLGKFPFQT